MSERFTELTGYSKEEATCRNCRFLQGEDTAEAPVSVLRNAIDARESASVALRNYRKDGTEFWNEVTIGPIRDESGSVTNYVGFQQDINEHKPTERQRERQLAQFEHFGGVLSHDLRTPLETARGRVDLALETNEDEHLHQAITALERVDDLLGELAKVMRQGDLVDGVEAVDLETLVRTVWEAFPTEEAELTVESERTIEADAEALTRLLETCCGTVSTMVDRGVQ